MNFKCIFFTTLFTLFCTLAYAANPSVNGVSGTVSDGETLQISGSNFGLRSRATPLDWMGGKNGFIESNETGSTFQKNNWTAAIAGGDTKPKYSTQKSHSYSKSIHLDYNAPQYDCGLQFHNADMKKLFVSAWFRIIKNDTSSKYQFKIHRVKEESSHSVTDGDSGVLSLMWKGAGGINVAAKTDSVSKIFPEDDRGWTKYWGGTELSAMQSKWVRMDFYTQRNSSANASDGVLTYNVIGVRDSFKSSTAVTHISGNENWNYMFLASFYGSVDDDVDLDADIFLDDIYVDESRSRVELCNTDSWDGRFDSGAECEIQPSTAWSSSSIKVTVNKGGSFTSGQKAYVYVVDANGNANSQGYQITIGADVAGDPTTPGDDPVDNDGSSASMVNTWDAMDQAGAAAGNWLDSSWSVCMRLLIEGSSITTSGNRFKLGFQGRSSGDYQIKKVSLAERDMDGSVGDVVDGEWIRVTFDGNDESTWDSDVTTVPANSEKLSNPIPYTIEAGKDYYVTMMIETPGVYIVAPSDYYELVFEGSDHTEELDWSSNGYGTYDARIHALSSIYVDSEGLPEPNGLMTIISP